MPQMKSLRQFVQPVREAICKLQFQDYRISKRWEPILQLILESPLTNPAAFYISVDRHPYFVGISFFIRFPQVCDMHFGCGLQFALQETKMFQSIHLIYGVFYEVIFRGSMPVKQILDRILMDLCPFFVNHTVSALFDFKKDRGVVRVIIPQPQLIPVSISVHCTVVGVQSRRIEVEAVNRVRSIGIGRSIRIALQVVLNKKANLLRFRFIDAVL